MTRWDPSLCEHLNTRQSLIGHIGTQCESLCDCINPFGPIDLFPLASHVAVHFWEHEAKTPKTFQAILASWKTILGFPSSSLISLSPRSHLGHQKGTIFPQFLVQFAFLIMFLGFCCLHVIFFDQTLKFSILLGFVLIFFNLNFYSFSPLK